MTTDINHITHVNTPQRIALFAKLAELLKSDLNHWTVTNQICNLFDEATQPLKKDLTIAHVAIDERDKLREEVAHTKELALTYSKELEKCDVKFRAMLAELKEEEALKVSLGQQLETLERQFAGINDDCLKLHEELARLKEPDALFTHCIQYMTYERLTKLFGTKSGPWPLGINPNMDRHAAAHGLAHWSCTSSQTNSWWLRIDGRAHEAKFSGGNGYPDELHKIDRDEPMGCSEFQYNDDKAELARVTKELRLLREDNAENTWVWQGDGHDNLESLTCPVLISAADLRAIIKRADGNLEIQP